MFESLRYYPLYWRKNEDTLTRMLVGYITQLPEKGKPIIYYKPDETKAETQDTVIEDCCPLYQHRLEMESGAIYEYSEI